jgi:Domain of unknown function (DUF4291)
MSATVSQLAAAAIAPSGSTLHSSDSELLDSGPGPSSESDSLTDSTIMPTGLSFEPYLNAVPQWPTSGQHILAQYDEKRDAIVVYQAYNRDIAAYAVEHNRFSGAPGFSLSRMTWIKSNFLWMMYRSGWGRKKNQEHTLAIFLKRTAFETILEDAIPTSFNPELFTSRAEFTKVVQQSKTNSKRCVLQWDPDHNPDGTKTKRRAAQWGIKNYSSYANGQDIIDIIDISDHVDSMRKFVRLDDSVRKACRDMSVPNNEHKARGFVIVDDCKTNKLSQLLIPTERLFMPSNIGNLKYVNLSHSVKVTVCDIPSESDTVIDNSTTGTGMAKETESA